MSKAKKFMSINLVSFVISIFTVLIYWLCEGVLEVDYFISTVAFNVFEIGIITFINMSLINKFKDGKFNFKECKKKYFKVMWISLITILISYLVTGLVLWLKSNVIDEIDFEKIRYGRLTLRGVGNFLKIVPFVAVYIVKIFLPFAFIIGTVSENSIKESITGSLKFVQKNLLKVIGFNVIFLSALWIVNFVSKFMIYNWENLFTYFLSSFFIEIVNCMILVTNLKIYLKNCKEKVEVNEVLEN